MSAAAPVRADLLLDRLCLMRSRSEAKSACEAGAVLSGGVPIRPSQSVGVGDRLTIRYPSRTVEIEVDAVPPKATSRKAAREMYRVIREDVAPRP